MNNTLHSSRRARRAFSARASLAAATLVLACGGCAFDQALAGLGNIFGAPAEAKTATNAQGGALEAVKRKVAGGADVQALRGEMLKSVGMCWGNNIKAARYLLENEAPLSREESSKWLVAVMAAQDQEVVDRLELAKLLIAKGANVNFDDDGDTPMGALLESNNPGMGCPVPEDGDSEMDNDETIEGESEPLFMLLVENGVNLNEVHENGYRGAIVSALGAALLNYSKQAAMRVLEKGASANAGEWAPLMCAASRGYTDIAKLLIEKGAKVNARANMDWTPLMFAARDGHANVARMLIEKGAKVNAVANEQHWPGWTALMLAADEGHADVVQLLVDKGANVGAVNKEKKTALVLAQEALNDNYIIRTEAQKNEFRRVISILKSASGKKGSAKKRK